MYFTVTCSNNRKADEGKKLTLTQGSYPVKNVFCVVTVVGLVPV